jgi:hypothetical protein
MTMINFPGRRNSSPLQINLNPGLKEKETKKSLLAGYGTSPKP